MHVIVPNNTMTMMNTNFRTRVADPGCALPEDIISRSKKEKQILFPETPPEEQVVDVGEDDEAGDEDEFGTVIGDEEETVVMGNRDRRPAEVTRIEKLNQICSIPEEERAARDRQLIEMYTRKKIKSKSEGHINILKEKIFVPTPATPSSTKKPSSALSPPSMPTKTPQELYPYYDLVVAEPSKIFESDFITSAAAKPPLRTETPLSMGPPRTPTKMRSASPPTAKKLGVFVPPFSPKFS